jgi:6-pyruvoyltetrahydropterin/6-carboxytetrahydropterin synthase
MERLIAHSDFHTAHRQLRYPGKCRFIHGHTWEGTLTLETERFPRNDLDMSIDFGDLKAVFRHMDHKMLVSEEDTAFSADLGFDPEGIIVIPGSNPSVENIAYYCMDKAVQVIQDQYPNQGLLYHMEIAILETSNNTFTITRDVTV